VLLQLTSLYVRHAGLLTAGNTKYKGGMASSGMRFITKFHEDPSVGSKVIMEGDIHTGRIFTYEIRKVC
jgi:hypothetical protein